MAPVILRNSVPRATASAIARWMQLIERHGTPAAALEALLHDVDRLDMLQRAVRSFGLDPDQMIQSVSAARHRA